MAKKIYFVYRQFFKHLKTVSGDTRFKKLSVLSLRYGLPSGIFDVLVELGLVNIRHDRLHTYIDCLYDTELTDEQIADIHDRASAVARAPVSGFKESPASTLSSVKSLRELSDRGWDHLRNQKSIAFPPYKIVDMNGEKFRVPVYNGKLIITIGERRIEIEV